VRAREGHSFNSHQRVLGGLFRAKKQRQDGSPLDGERGPPTNRRNSQKSLYALSMRDKKTRRNWTGGKEGGNQTFLRKGKGEGRNGKDTGVWKCGEMFRGEKVWEGKKVQREKGWGVRETTIRRQEVGPLQA